MYLSLGIKYSIEDSIVSTPSGIVNEINFEFSTIAFLIIVFVFGERVPINFPDSILKLIKFIVFPWNSVVSLQKIVAKKVPIYKFAALFFNFKRQQI